MNLILPIKEYNSNQVEFGEKIKNTVIWNSVFIKLFYSTTDIILNGIFFLINIKNKNIYKEYGKNKISFSVKENADIVSKIEQIEKTILHKVNINNKTPRLSIYEQFKNGILKINFNSENYSNNQECILKLSGIWENVNEYGITFKMYLANHPLNNN